MVVATTTTATAAAATPAPPPSSAIEVEGRPLLPLGPGEDLHGYVGRQVDVRGATVLSVDSDEGFWVGEDDAGRVWVQLSTEGESPAEVRAGDRISFSGRFVEHGQKFAGEIGVDDAEGAALLVAHRGHIEVAAGDVTISRG